MLVLVCLEIVLILIGAWFAPNVPLAYKSFWMHPIVPLADEAQVNARFGLFGDSANLDVR
jgi:hypothetical protein